MSFGGFAFFPPVIKYLLIINAGVFLLQNFFLPALHIGSTSIYKLFFDYFALQPIFGSRLQGLVKTAPFLPWQLITYMFMHGSFMHLFFNMFALWMFGVELENLWGSKKFLFYYFLCGIGAGLANLLIAPFFTTVGPTVGASGSIYGVLVAFGFLFPNREIYIYFLLPVKAKYLVVLYMALEIFSVASQQESGVAHVAHLGGALVGIVYLLITKGRSQMSFFGNSPRKSAGSFFSTQSKQTPFGSGQGFSGTGNKAPDVKEASYVETELYDYKKEQDEKQAASQKKIDDILDKLSAGGYQSLTEEEKKTLFREGKKIR